MNEPFTFKDFAFFLQAKRLKEAAMTLGLLLDLDDPNAEKATIHFVNQLQTQPGFFMKLMSLKDEIEKNDQNAALFTLMNCFGFDGSLALVALKKVTESMRPKT